jgi:tyrosine-protein phosphatase SIW14
MTSQADIPATKSKRPTRPIGKKIWISFAVFMAVLIGGTFSVYWYNNIQTYHLAPVQNGVLYRDGNRDLREFKHTITFTGAKTVVSLIDDKELTDPNKPQFLQETNYCTGKQLQYIRIPVSLGGWPKSEDLKTFIAIVSNPANQPVLVHCAQGVRRTGMFVAAYQESVMHESPDRVKNEILFFGHKAEDLDDVRKFVDLYVPGEMALPTTMPVGKE